VPGLVGELKGLVAEFHAGVVEGWDEGQLLAGLVGFEVAKRQLEARQAMVTARLVQVRSEAAEARKRSARNVPAAVSRDVGLARGMNGSRASDVVHLACQGPAQAPRLFQLWWDGKASEEQALVLFRQTSLLTPAGRAEADRRVADDVPLMGVGLLRKRGGCGGGRVGTGVGG
jgi:hypothetical protein